jgi:hypothetical protein
MAFHPDRSHRTQENTQSLYIVLRMAEGAADGMLRRCGAPDIAVGRRLRRRRCEERIAMNNEGVDALTRTVAAQDRRRSLQTMSVAALAALGMAPRLGAAKGKAGKAAKKKCKKQVAPCEAAFAETCAGAPSAEDCRNSVAECCAFLGSCNAGAAMECFVTLLLTKG